MSKIYCLCGFIGSGKTTYAKHLAQQYSAFRFSIDEWMIPLYGEHMEREIFDARLNTLKSLFKESALQMLNLGVSVIFDFGLWKEQDRSELKQWAQAQDIECELIYLDVEFDVCQQRAIARNEHRGEHAYEMTPEMLSLFWSWFEVPTANENITKVTPE
ncbi:ATP-binding protein [Vibrio sp. 10N.261.55.A7]|uniref:AAA family ATPase n=1 Tax=Vibrio sp. 10N.261.55.A7 TaxID=1880851 RepID=UPI000C86409B|nr:ATP-binding protein [Vibrio sp. 10N.261.55.A7]PMJ89923.1 AAA family ATPase [Vibrio sp. 10N.261.55.A7]